MERIIKLYVKCFGAVPDKIQPIKGSASKRSYFRVSGERAAVIATIGCDRRENEAFIYLAGHFAQKGLPVPEILAVSSDKMVYLQSDLGETSLLRYVNTYGEEASYDVLCLAVDTLARFNHTGASGIDWNKCYPRPAMDQRSVMWDLNYFKYCCLKPAGIEPDDDLMENAMAEFADSVIQNPSGTLMLRDFQSRNIMLKSDTPYVIDFQGARAGSGLYDLASLLWQARLGLSHATRSALAEVYREASGIDKVDYELSLKRYALLRMLQVLGAYGFRGDIQGNAAFIEPMARALRNLGELAESMDGHIPAYLSEMIRLLVATHPSNATDGSTAGLTVKVMSFSYKQGMPKDWSGNGGGFVFDCRALPNPGRYEKYKHLTGRDADVIQFIESDGEMLEYLEQCYSLVERSVKRYIQRGFTSLMVSFGCTGGQHRSVYGAEWMAHRLADNFLVNVDLIHREQNIKLQLSGLCKRNGQQ